jgi:hypothetical protein
MVGRIKYAIMCCALFTAVLLEIRLSPDAVYSQKQDPELIQHEQICNPAEQ